MKVSRARLRALEALKPGPCRVSNRTEPDDRLVAHATAESLADADLASITDHGDHRTVELTDAGHALAEDPPAPPPITREHGTHACYVLDQCRCDDCRRANSDYEAKRARDIAYGRPRMVDADPVRDHVRSLMADRKVGSTNGVGLKQIAKVSGVAHGALWKLMYGAPDRERRSQQVRRETAEALLAVTEADRADGSTIAAGPTVRRLHDIRDAGATWTEISDQIGGSGAGNVCALVHRSHVTVGTARAVYALWRQLQDGTWEPRGRRPRWSVNPKTDDDEEQAA